jgi:hypothetical protein
MQTTNQANIEARVAARFRTLVTLWFALCMSVVLYFVLVLVAGPTVAGASQNPLLSIILMLLGGSAVIGGHLVRWQMVKRAIAERRVELIQTGMIVGCALSEVAPLLGLLDRFAALDPYYYVLFIIGGASMLLHFPRRSQLLASM